MARGDPRRRRSGGDNHSIDVPAPPDHPPGPPGDYAPAWLSRLARLIVPAENPAAGVYGLLAVASLMAAESGLHETYLDAVLSAVIAAALFWLLHAYADLLGRRILSPERLRASVLFDELARDLGVIRGAAIPLAALLVAWLAGADQSTGVLVALWSSVLGLVVFELLAAVRVHASARELVLDTSVGVAMGGAVVALKIVLH